METAARIYSHKLLTNFQEHDELLTTTCPQCHAKCTSREYSQKCGSLTRHRATMQNLSNGRQFGFNESFQQQDLHNQSAASLPPAAPTQVDTNTNNEENNRVQNIVSAVISARHATLFDDLENRVSQILDQKLDNIVANLIERINITAPPLQQAPPVANSSPANTNFQHNVQQNVLTPPWPRAVPQIYNDSNQTFHRNIDQIRFSDALVFLIQEE
ncbi:unnamed protein product [Ceratitis capitata]|uniref:(Mediterranean fruit fly) hypothetical protein n=1 Tax=Ceratitis capitata TaxID=7213 RepID=A0A811UQX6_CERCA|nr:unnamed protein product [Ceratitis capitata]